MGGGQLTEPCNKTDIRPWVMAMDYVNPPHWDLNFANNTKYGGIIAPQSMAVSLDYGHGVQPACVGKIPGSHLIFGGEEWWWFGTHTPHRRSRRGTGLQAGGQPPLQIVTTVSTYNVRSRPSQVTAGQQIILCQYL